MIRAEMLQAASFEETEAEYLSALEHYIVHHAWLTLDGVHAIEDTFRGDPDSCCYWGTQFDKSSLMDFMIRTGEQPPIVLGSDYINQSCSAKDAKLQGAYHASSRKARR
jgi:hypothetical protein